MNIVAPFCAEQPAGVSNEHGAKGFESFRDPACAAAVLHRELPSGVLAWLAELDPEALPNGRAVLPANAVRAAATQFCMTAGMSEGWQRDWLVDDIADLAQQFAEVMQAADVRLRLQAVTTNACRKFHRDAVTGRLLCTYRGTGTQYGTAEAGADPELIFTAPTGVPVLLRGSLWPPKPESNLLHRSPPIETTGETRLLLVVDPIFDLEEAE